MARRRGGGRVIDNKEWQATPFSQSVIAADGTSPGGGITFAIPATILRMRGYVQAVMDSSAQVGDDIVLTFGFAVLATDAFIVGASLPDPFDEPSFPWLWWGEMTLIAQTTTPVMGWGPHAQRLEVDSKAMRRVKPNQTLGGIVQASGATGAPNTIVTFGSIRTLIGT